MVGDRASSGSVARSSRCRRRSWSPCGSPTRASGPLPSGFYTSAPPLGGVFALLLTNSVLLPVFGDWRAVLLFEAGLSVAAALAWVAVSGRAPSEPVAHPTRSATAGAAAALGAACSAAAACGWRWCSASARSSSPKGCRPGCRTCSRSTPGCRRAPHRTGRPHRWRSESSRRLVMPGLASPGDAR